MENIESILSTLKVEDLKRLKKKANIKMSDTTAYNLSMRLLEYYSKPNFVKDLFQNLSAFDKDILTCIVQNFYIPYKEDFNMIFKKYKITKKVENNTKECYAESCFSDESLARVLYIGESIPECLRKELNSLIPAINIRFSGVDDIELKENIVGRKNRIEDFVTFIKFINTNNVPVTKSENFITKAKLLQFCKLANYTEVLNTSDKLLEDINTAKEAIVGFGLIKLLQNAQVISIQKDKYVLGINTDEFLILNDVEKVKFLLKYYLNSTDKIIDECSRIKANILNYSKSEHYLGKARKAIIDYVKLCDINKWIYISDFTKKIAQKSKRFLKNLVHEIRVRDEYYTSDYYEPEFEEFESKYISIVLMEYLAVLGIIDVSLEYYNNDYYSREYIYVEYFRLTDFGAYVLGINDNYVMEDGNSKEISDDIIVTDTFEIIIGNSNKAMQYEIYFQRFCDKIDNVLNNIMYKLDYSSIMKAEKIDISITEIYEYLNKITNLPLNVTEQFDEWIYQSKRLNFKNMSVIETTEEFLDIIIGSIKETDKIRVALDEKQLVKVKNKLESLNIFYH